MAQAKNFEIRKAQAGIHAMVYTAKDLLEAISYPKKAIREVKDKMADVSQEIQTLFDCEEPVLEPSYIDVTQAIRDMAHNGICDITNFLFIDKGRAQYFLDRCLQTYQQSTDKYTPELEKL